MAARIVTVVLLLVLGLLLAQMWLGRGSIPNVSALQAQLERQVAANEELRQANKRLESEIEDLKTGLGIVEEKARSELGMVHEGEIFVQYTQQPPAESED